MNFPVVAETEPPAMEVAVEARGTVPVTFAPVKFVSCEPFKAGTVVIKTPVPRFPALTPEAETVPAPIAYPANSAVNELMEYVVEAVTT